MTGPNVAAPSIRLEDSVALDTNTNEQDGALTAFEADRAETKYVDGTTARFAYRRIGPRSGVPLVMAVRFRATMDHWDPAFLDALAVERDVIVFDNRGVGLSTGTPPSSIGDMADGLLEFIDALDLTEVDLLGWSMGGYVVQVAALTRAALVRRLIVAASGPGRVPDTPALSEHVVQIIGKRQKDEADVLYEFWPHTDAGREAGIASERRLDKRLSESHANVSDAAVDGQRAAIFAFGAGVWDRLNELTIPVLVANGARDVLIDTQAFTSYQASQRLPNAKIVLYSDASHAFLFQHADDFGQEVLDFLR